MKLKNYIAVRIPTPDAPVDREVNDTISSLQNKNENKKVKELPQAVLGDSTVSGFFYQNKENK